MGLGGKGNQKKERKKKGAQGQRLEDSVSPGVIARQRILKALGFVRHPDCSRIGLEAKGSRTHGRGDVSYETS